MGGLPPFISLSQSDYLYGDDLILKLLDQVMEVKLAAFWRCPLILVLRAPWPQPADGSMAKRSRASRCDFARCQSYAGSASLRDPRSWAPPSPGKRPRLKMSKDRSGVDGKGAAWYQVVQNDRAAKFARTGPIFERHIDDLGERDQFLKEANFVTRRPLS